MGKRLRVLVTILIVLLFANVAVLNVRMEDRAKQDLILATQDDLVFQQSLSRDIDLLNSIEECFKEIKKHEDAVPDLVAKINPSVVIIEIPCRNYNSYFGEEKIVWGGGAGVVYDDEHILTAAHLVYAIKNVDPSLPSSRILTYDGKVWDILDAASADDFNLNQFGSADIGMLKVKLPKKYPQIQLGSINNLRYGQSMVVIGHPMMERYCASVGIISRIGSYKNGLGGILLQTDALVSDGNSGGPILGLDGLCYGLCSFTFENLNYFISIKTIKEKIPELLEKLDNSVDKIEY